MSELALFPTLTAPIAPSAPDQPYDKLLIWLAFAPRIDGATVDGTIAVRAQPYRVLDGVVDTAPEGLIKTLNVGSVLEAAAKDATLANTLTTLAATILTYLE